MKTGSPYPLGANVTSTGVNFSVFSYHATRAELLLFDTEDAIQPSRIIDLVHETSRTSHYWQPIGELERVVVAHSHHMLASGLIALDQRCQILRLHLTLQPDSRARARWIIHVDQGPLMHRCSLTRASTRSGKIAFNVKVPKTEEQGNGRPQRTIFGSFTPPAILAF
jgi:Carbohydrate-binding module 48 (Isoamylase N-terminal domain)